MVADTMSLPAPASPAHHTELGLRSQARTRFGAERGPSELFLLAFLLLCLPVLAAETDVQIAVSGQLVRATLEVPAGPRAPAVLLLHGFTGSRDELEVAGTGEGVLERTARLLAEAGYASLRIDFRGSGDSDGVWADTTFSGQIADAVAAIDWLKKQPSIDGERLAILGWSQGGLIAAHAAKEKPELNALILWAPVVHPMYSYESLLGPELFATAMNADPETLMTGTLSWGAETTLKASFFQEMPFFNTTGAVAAYPGPMKVIVGSRDDAIYPQPATSEALLRYHPGEESLSMFDTDHVWDAFSGPEVLDGQMLPATIEWLRAHL
jgi:dienelactone hydrolase